MPPTPMTKRTSRQPSGQETAALNTQVQCFHTQQELALSLSKWPVSTHKKRCYHRLNKLKSIIYREQNAANVNITLNQTKYLFYYTGCRQRWRRRRRHSSWMAKEMAALNTQVHNAFIHQQYSTRNIHLCYLNPLKGGRGPFSPPFFLSCPYKNTLVLS
jgi:hypothetical protein